MQNDTFDTSSFRPDSETPPANILSGMSRCPSMGENKNEDKDTYEYVDPLTGEIDVQSFPGDCECNRCPYCGPKKRKSETAHYFNELREKEGWHFLTVTSRRTLRGTPSQRRAHFKKWLTSFQDSVGYYSKKCSLEETESPFEYIRVVEGGLHKKTHGHFLYRSSLSRSKIQEIWKKHGGGYITFDVLIEDEGHLLSVVYYMQSQRFFNPRKPDQYVPKGLRTISSTDSIESYNTESVKERQIQHARRRAAYHLFNGERPESRILCDEEALRFGQKTYLPRMVGEPVQSLQADWSGILEEWSDERALVRSEGKRREVDPYNLIPEGRQAPILIQGRASSSRPPGGKRCTGEDPLPPPEQKESSVSIWVERREDGSFAATVHDEKTGEEEVEVYEEYPLPSEEIPDIPAEEVGHT